MLKSVVAIAAAGIAMTAALGVGAACAEAPPLSIYGRLPNVEQIEISPDGAKLAIAMTDGEKRMLPEERQVRDRLAKSVVANADIPIGTVISSEMLTVKGPGNGLALREDAWNSRYASDAWVVRVGS